MCRNEACSKLPMIDLTRVVLVELPRLGTARWRGTTRGKDEEC